MGYAHCVIDRGIRATGIGLCSFLDEFCRNSCNFRDLFRGIGADSFLQCFKVFRAFTYETVVMEIVPYDDVHDPVNECHISSAFLANVKVSPLGQFNFARITYYKFFALPGLFFEP